MGFLSEPCHDLRRLFRVIPDSIIRTRHHIETAACTTAAGTVARFNYTLIWKPWPQSLMKGPPSEKQGGSINDILRKHHRKALRCQSRNTEYRKRDVIQKNNVITTNNTKHTIKGNVKNRASILPDSPSCPSEFCWEGAE